MAANLAANLINARRRVIGRRAFRVSAVLPQGFAAAAFEPSEIQDLADAVPKLLELKAKSNVPISFQVQIEVGDGDELPAGPIADSVNSVLEAVKAGFRVQ